MRKIPWLEEREIRRSQLSLNKLLILKITITIIKSKRFRSQRILSHMFSLSSLLLKTRSLLLEFRIRSANLSPWNQFILDLTRDLETLFLIRTILLLLLIKFKIYSRMELKLMDSHWLSKKPKVRNSMSSGTNMVIIIDSALNLNSRNSPDKIKKRMVDVMIITRRVRNLEPALLSMVRSGKISIAWRIPSNKFWPEPPIIPHYLNPTPLC